MQAEEEGGLRLPAELGAWARRISSRAVALSPFIAQEVKVLPTSIDIDRSIDR
jgi:hypothetical protein